MQFVSPVRFPSIFARAKSSISGLTVVNSIRNNQTTTYGFSTISLSFSISFIPLGMIHSFSKYVWFQLCLIHTYVTYTQLQIEKNHCEFIIIHKYSVHVTIKWLFLCDRLVLPLKMYDNNRPKTHIFGESLSSSSFYNCHICGRAQRKI